MFPFPLALALVFVFVSSRGGKEVFMNIVQTVQTKFCDPVLTKFSTIKIWILQSGCIRFRKISIIRF